MTQRAKGVVAAAAPDRYVGAYLRGGRIFSYAHQIHSALSFQPRRLLEVGVGRRVVSAAIAATGVEVTTLDTEFDLRPDLVASVTRIPFSDEAFDVAICCQVLEHIPFAEFGVALRELRRVTKRGLVLSLPDISKHYYAKFLLPVVGRRELSVNLPRIFRTTVPEEQVPKGGHFCEIGYRGYGRRRIQSEIRKSGWIISSSWRVPELRWHRFFRLEKAQTL